jgi:hypothetical protein
MRNTIKHFLATYNPQKHGINCPCCGNVMSIRNPGTFDLILTENARLETDALIERYRSYLQGIETMLEEQNIYGTLQFKGEYPFVKEGRDFPTMKEKGVHTGTQGAIFLNEFADKTIDYLDFAKLFKDFPTIAEIDTLLNHNPLDQQESLKAIVEKIKKVITALEPKSIAGILPDLIFAQKDVTKWIDKYSKEQDKINSLVKEIVPYIDNYFHHLKQIVQLLNIDDSKEDEGIFRVKLILTIFLGHQSRNNLDTVAGLNIKANAHYCLPRLTSVSNKLLIKLICSEVIISNANFGWDAEFVKAIRQIENAGQQAKNNFDFLGIANKVTTFVNFACTGIIADNALEIQKCSWYPKQEPTHCVLLYGSPGTSKSTVMLTGFVNFYSTVSSLGINIHFESPNDEARYKKLSKEYWEGKMPDPNKEGELTIIKLSVESPNIQNFQKAHYVFVDIAGEIAARSLTEEGSDPAVLRRLKNAKTIIFFFDPSIEPCIREKLIQSKGENAWKNLQENYERVKNSRQNRSDVSQIQLLRKLIEDLKTTKGQNNLTNTNVICIIPKTDLYYNEDNSQKFFLTEFYNSLRTNQMLIRSPYYQNESFAGLHSLAGIGTQLVNTGHNIQQQKEIGKELSQLALNGLKNIGNALGDEPELNPLRISLNDTLKAGVIDTLNKAFGSENSYFIPVSALGYDNQANELGHPPNQKLSEYVFILPIALTATEVNEQPNQNPAQ